MAIEPNPSEMVAVVPYDHIVFTDLDGTEGVLVDLNSKSFYRLNETAMLVWRCVEQRATVAEIINKMMLSYDVSADRAASSVRRLLQSFRTYKLVN